jgi:hypothetical protein
MEGRNRLLAADENVAALGAAIRREQRLVDDGTVGYCGLANCGR